jgi:hypothetical protein
MGDGDDPTRRKGLGFRWDPGYAAAVVTLIGGLAYTVFRLAYALFYERLGTTPEEVGLGYGQTIVRGVIPALTIACLSLTAIIYLLMMGLSIVHQVPEIAELRRFAFKGGEENGREPPEPPENQSASRADAEPRPHLFRILYPQTIHELEENGLGWRPLLTLSKEVLNLTLRTYSAFRSAPIAAFRLPRSVYTGPVGKTLTNRFTFVGVIVVTMVSLPLLALREAGRVGEGRLPNAFISAATGLSVIEVTPVTTDAAKPLEPPLKGSTTLLYLGGSGGTVVIYDYTTKTTVRVSMSRVILVTDRK